MNNNEIIKKHKDTITQIEGEPFGILRIGLLNLDNLLDEARKDEKEKTITNCLKELNKIQDDLPHRIAVQRLSEVGVGKDYRDGREVGMVVMIEKAIQKVKEQMNL